MSTVTLTLPYPVSANRYWHPVYIKGKNGVQGHITIVPTKEAKAYKAEVALIARAAGITSPIEGRVKIEYLLYPHRPLDWEKRMRELGEFWDDSVQCIDLGNANKVLEDALKGVIYVDDRWTWRMFGYRMPPDEHGKRLVVQVTKILPKAQQQQQPQLV